MKKKLLSTILSLSLSATGIITAQAYNIGDVIGETLRTDIVASINNHNIPSHNYNGYTMVVAEDLRNFGFDVVWNQETRSLSIDRNPAVNSITSTYIAPVVTKDLVGTKSMDVLYTDIRTFVQGREVPGYNLGGITIINLEELRVFGETIYNNDTRTLDINIYDGLQFKTTDVFANISDTNQLSVSNWASVSPVQQFEYKAEGFAYAYAEDNVLKIVTPQKKLQIFMEYPFLGDVISDDAGNFYVVWGKDGNENYNEETIFISKYSENGVHIKTTGFVGTSVMGETGNTKYPFDAGNCDSAIANGCLMVSYAREMYSGHQSNNVIGVYTEDMSPVAFTSNWDIPYNSHSFNQRIIWSELAQDFVYADHGDAYDRGFKITTKGNEHNIFNFYLPSNSNYNMFVVNKTFAQLGGLLETSSGVVLVGASAKSISDNVNNEYQNLFVQIFNPNATEISAAMFVGGETRSGATSFDINDNQNKPLTPVTDFGVHWLTNNTDSHVIAPHAVVADDKIVIFWNENGINNNGAFYTVLSSDGTTLTPATSLGNDVYLNSNEDPVYCNGKVYWAASSNGQIKVTSINI